jgi:DNA/RNA-binding domain of Phe-tRNA-synthetase-like protein
VLLVNQALFRRYQNKNSCLPDVLQVVVVMKSFSLQLLLPPRLLNIAKYINDLRELRVFGVNSEVHRAGG